MRKDGTHLGHSQPSVYRLGSFSGARHEADGGGVYCRIPATGEEKNMPVRAVRAVRVYVQYMPAVRVRVRVCASAQRGARAAWHYFIFFIPCPLFLLIPRHVSSPHASLSLRRPSWACGVGRHTPPPPGHTTAGPHTHDAHDTHRAPTLH